MTNFYWYLGLFFISILPAIVTIYIKRRVYKVSTLIVFYLFAACITWIGEFTVLGIFDSYEYRTGIFNDHWAQNITGHLLLNCSMYPSAAIIIVTNKLKFLSKFIILFLFLLPEYMFTKLGIYQQHWWKYYMSIITVILYMNIVKIWFHRLLYKKGKYTREITLFFVAFIIIHIPIPILLIFQKQYYYLDFLLSHITNLYRASTIFIFTYHLLESFMIVYFICILRKLLWKLTAIIISILGQVLLAGLHVIVFLNDWNLTYLLFIYVFSILAFIFVEKYTLEVSISN